MENLQKEIIWSFRNETTKLKCVHQHDDRDIKGLYDTYTIFENDKVVFTGVHRSYAKFNYDARVRKAINPDCQVVTPF